MAGNCSSITKAPSLRSRVGLSPIDARRKCHGTKVAAQCGSTAAGYDTWKRQFAAQARGKGITASSLAALTATSYATATIAADRGQRSFRLSLEQFLAKRGGSEIVARARGLTQSQAALFASIQ